MGKFSIEDILGSSDSNSEKYAFNPEKIDSFFRHAALMTLLKAKAKTLLADLPRVERVVYNDCAENANSPLAMSKCLLKLIKIRDYGAENRLLPSSRHFFGPNNDEISPNVYGYPRETSTEEYLSLFGQWKRVVTNIAYSFMPFKSWPKHIPTEQLTANRRTLNESITDKNSSKEGYHRPSYAIYPSPSMPSTRNNSTYYSLLRRKLLLKSYGEKDVSFIRRKKSIPERKILRNFDNMKKLQRYISMANRYNSYMKRTTEHNVKFLKSLPSFSGSMFEVRDKSTIFAQSLADKIEQIFRQFHFQKFSILSPRMFSIFPSHSKHQNGEDAKSRIMSPELFSFHNNSGFLPLPQLFGLTSMDEKESLEWIDLILEMSGTGRSIQKLLDKHIDEINMLEHNLYPAILKMERRDRKWERMKRSLTPSQKTTLREQSYVFLNTGQQRLIYGVTDNGMTYGNEIDKEKHLEKEIESLASLEYVLQRLPRSANNNSNGTIAKDTIVGGEGAEPSHIGGESPDTEHGSIPQIVALTPWALENRFGGVILEGIFLSPHAFAAEIISPELLTLHVLSPRAFIAAILSPLALGAKILSPAAFRAEILSPEALSAYILTPEAFITEILSPCVLETRIVSPKAMVLQVLSPVAGGPRIASPESGGVIVLSPNILSPRINSTESYIVEVLSPHILGGEHHSHENERTEFGGLVRILGPPGAHESHHHHDTHESHDHNSHDSHNHESHGSHDSHAGHEQKSPTSNNQDSHTSNEDHGTSGSLNIHPMI
ncbi:moulting cycle domain-containing protein [Ditylenchus destructor]|uniref:Moulting cycle domain-containing protein n=1 Tax=Ditylenchus destructor TaxID=166010 RepID=A0AAD4N2G5_9BILA|nr:moulting cycle domain-containing protein [Ditylenchus destructor]